MEINTPVRNRRTHTESFKQSVIDACQVPGTSVAGVALTHGVNANQVRRWMRERGVELVATPAEMLVEGKKPPKLNGVTQEQMSRMEREMANLQGQYKLVEQTYAEDVLNLVLARGYLAKLLDNKSVVRYIKQRRPEVLEQFEVIVETTSLDQ